jgi:hypothetical protein
MKDISQPIYFWISCSNDLWRKWFSNRFNGAYEFSEIEEFLFQILVMRSLEQTESKPKVEDLINRLRVQYINDFQGNRQVCITQKTGNIFCKNEEITLNKEIDYKVKSIDSMGTMMDSEPYVEVIVGGKIVLETPENLRFLLLD